MQKTYPRIALWFVCGAIGWFIFSSCHYFYWAGMDDDLITLWSGETLGRDWWFINYNGIRSEMTSSILAALVAKIAFWISPALDYSINKLLLYICAPAALWLLWHDRKLYLRAEHANALGAAAVVVAATMPYLQHWSLSSMEAPLHCLILTWYAFLLIGYTNAPTRANGHWLIAAQCLLILVRPEGFWAIGTTFIMLAMIYGRGVFTAHRRIYLYPLIFFLSLLLARYAATGLIFPNPAYAKVDLGWPALMNGFGQLRRFYRFDLPQMLLAASLITAILLILRDVIKGGPQNNILLALTLVICAHEFFFMIVGGGSGPFLHRLLVPTTLLKCCLLFHLLSYYGNSRFIAQAGMILGAALGMNYVLATIYFSTRSVEREGLHYDVRQPLRDFSWHSSLEQMNWQIVMMNFSHGRDANATYDFILHELPKQLDQLEELRILTYQAGFFPYMIKKIYPQADIRFFDSNGLITAFPEVASAGKNVHGIANYYYMNGLLSGRHPLSPLVRQFDPNMMYTLGLWPEDREELPKLGWKILYRTPDSVIWIKQ